EPLVLTVLPDLEDPVIGAVTPLPGTPFTSGDAVSLSALVTDDVAVETVTFQVGDRTLVDSTAPYEATVSAPPVFTTTDLPIRVEAVDPSGNRATLDFTVPVEPIQDTQPPVPTFLSPGDGDAVLAGTEVTVALEIADDHFIDGYVLTLDGETIGARAFIEQPFFEDQLVLTIPAEAAPGRTFTLELTASDFGGNVGVAEVALAVVDGTVLTGDQTLDSSLDGQDLILGTGTFTVIGPFAPGSLHLLGGARVVGEAGQPLRLAVQGALHVGGGASIDVSGLGFPGSGASGSVNGGAPAGISPSTQDAGGSHGGTGNAWDSGSAGEVYDSVYVPQLGGGGGARDQDGVDQGLPGGGVLEITAAGVTVNGALLARGLGDASNRAGGAGGSVLITATTLSGTGLIDVSGGSTLPCCTTHRTGSGGGGRVALYVDQLQGFDPVLQVRAHGGARRDTNGVANGFAGPGTILVSTSTSTFGDLLVDQGDPAGQPVAQTPLPAVGTGLVGATFPDAEDPAAMWIEPQDPGARFALGVSGAYVRIDGVDFRVLAQTTDRRRVLLEGANGVVDVGDAYLGVYKLDVVTVRGGATLVFFDEPEVGLFDVAPDSQVIDNSP
ncbi:MAG TPA: Ig-like domain-containing protein, partial [Thermoanaerobaculia bacterium]